ncbi:MAG: RNA polymerase sigma factor, partial [Acidimicrobiia bacterium]
AGYRGDGSVLSWLLSIARRTCADDVRRRRRERRLGSRLALVRFDDPPAPTAVDELLAGLDPDRREAFVLTQVVGLAYAEAAEVIGCPIGTVRSRVARARADLAAAVRAADAG